MKLTAIAFGLLVLAYPASAADDARAVVDRAIKAFGADKLPKHTAQTWTAKGTMAALKLAYTAEYTFQAPDKFRFEMEADFGGKQGKLIAATNGKAAWESAFGMTRDMAAQKAAEFQHNTYLMNICRLTPLTDPAFQLSVADGQPDADKFQTVLVKHKDRRDVFLKFDKTTGLLHSARSQVHDEFSMKETTQDVTFTGYKEKDGVKAFETLTIQRGGKDVITEELSNVKVHDALDAKLFEKPADAK